MKAYARFDEIINMGYFFNGLSILDVKFANLVPPWHHVYGMTGNPPPPFYFRYSKGN